MVWVWYGFTWKSTRIKVLGVWLGETGVRIANYEERYAAIIAKMRTWSRVPLSPLGKVRVANIFLYSRLWYQTEISPPLARTNERQGYEDVERQVASWVFRGRQEVAAARLKDAYELGGAQLIDIKDKVRTQRVGWLSRLLTMPRDAFPRVVAEALIGTQNAGYSGLDILSSDLSNIELKTQGHERSMAVGGFYWEAIKAWSALSQELTLAQGNLHNDHIFFNPQIRDETGATFRPTLWMARHGLMTVDRVRTVSGVGLRRPQWDQLVALRGRIPDLPRSDEPIFMFKTKDEPKDLRRVPFKDIYVTFRSKTTNGRHFEDKWTEALGIDIGDEWKQVWTRVHKTKCNLKAKSNVWRQLNLNFWTCYMDHAYILRGDGLCPLCQTFARFRWHVVIECETVKKLWKRLLDMVTPLGGTTTLQPIEMAFGLDANDNGLWLRNRLGFILRSVIMTMRGIRVGGVDETVDRLWSIFLRRLKQEVIEEWYLAKLEGSLTLFESRTLVAGLLGRLVNGCVEWNVELSEVTYDYFNLFN